MISGITLTSHSQRGRSCSRVYVTWSPTFPHPVLHIPFMCYARQALHLGSTGVELPSSPVDPKCKACPAYYIKGICNTGCGNVGDHVTHTWEQDLPLWEWAVRLMPDITAPSAPVA